MHAYGSVSLDSYSRVPPRFGRALRTAACAPVIRVENFSVRTRVNRAALDLGRYRGLNFGKFGHRPIHAGPARQSGGTR
jgi:hypothetical protein